MPHVPSAPPPFIHALLRMRVRLTTARNNPPMSHAGLSSTSFHTLSGIHSPGQETAKGVDISRRVRHPVLCSVDEIPRSISHVGSHDMAGRVSVVYVLMN
jgi:hypothetical protein